MLSREIQRLEKENLLLKEELRELGVRMNNNVVAKPKSCQYCKHFVQHYIKINPSGSFTAIYDGHCVRCCSKKYGRIRKTNVDETCQFFELGVHQHFI